MLLTNGSFYSNARLYTNGSVLINGTYLADAIPLLSDTFFNSSGGFDNCTIRAQNMSAFTVLNSVVANLFSRVDSSLFGIYSLTNGIGGTGNTNLSSIGNNPVGSLNEKYQEINATISNITVKL